VPEGARRPSKIENNILSAAECTTQYDRVISAIARNRKYLKDQFEHNAKGRLVSCEATEEIL